MKNVLIPKKETKVKRLLVQVAPSDHETIMQYCKIRKSSVSDMIRFDIENTYDLKLGSWKK